MTKFPTAVTALAGAAALVVAGCGQEKAPTPKIPPTPTEQQIIDAATPGVVAIKARTESNTYTGTGFFVDPEHVITAAHVTNAVQNLKVRLSDGSVISARLLGERFCRDYSMLQLTQAVPNATILPLADGSLLSSNERIDVLHYGTTSVSDFGRQDMQTSALTVSDPRVKNPTLGSGTPRLFDLIQFEGESAPGASGAPMLDATGKVVGVLSLGDNMQTWGLPISQIRQSLDALRGGDRRDSLGIEMTPIADIDLPALFAADPSYQSRRLGRLVDAYIRHFGLQGLYVESVADDGPADGKVGYGDMITHINGVRVRSVRGMCGAIESAAPGEKITITGMTINGGTTARDVLAEWKVSFRLRK